MCLIAAGHATDANLARVQRADKVRLFFRRYFSDARSWFSEIISLVPRPTDSSILPSFSVSLARPLTVRLFPKRLNEKQKLQATTKKEKFFFSYDKNGRQNFCGAFTRIQVAYVCLAIERAGVRRNINAATCWHGYIKLANEKNVHGTYIMWTALFLSPFNFV